MNHNKTFSKFSPKSQTSHRLLIISDKVKLLVKGPALRSIYIERWRYGYISTYRECQDLKYPVETGIEHNPVVAG